MDEQQNMSHTPPLTDGTIFFSPADSAQPQSQAASTSAAYDPLESAKNFPGLFPGQEEPVQETPPTIASRPIKLKKNKTWKILRNVLTVLLSVFLTVAILVGGLLGYLTVTEYNPAYAEAAKHGAVNISKLYRPEDPSGGKNSLRILSFNTGYAGLGSASDFFMDGGDEVNPSSESYVRENMEGIETVLVQTDADILLLQEVDTDSDRSYHLNQWAHYEGALEEYESRFALNYSCRLVPYPIFNRIGQVQSGLATYSRYDISSATRFSLPNTAQWPARACYLKRCMLVTRLHIEGVTESVLDEDGMELPNEYRKELVVVNVHLEAYDDGAAKAAQAKQIIEFIQKEYEKQNYVIVGGDFNQAFPNSTLLYGENEQWQPGVLEELPEDWQYVYDNKTPTCRLLNEPYDPQSGNTQYYVIDGYILSPNLTASKIETLDENFRYSDHNPVLLEVTLK